jgi:hypothetical protein
MNEKPELTDQEILDRLASWIVERRMTAPAILFLESHRPLAFIGSQALIFTSPVVHVFESFLQALAGPGWRHVLFARFAELLEDRANVDRLVIAIERRSQEQREHLRAEKARQKALKQEAKARTRAERAERRQAARRGTA